MGVFTIAARTERMTAFYPRLRSGGLSCFDPVILGLPFVAVVLLIDTFRVFWY